jgi:spermidine synthase
MSHDEAVRILAAERYLLMEFDERVREAFEEHFFACSDCAADLRIGVAFLDGLRGAT